MKTANTIKTIGLICLYLWLLVGIFCPPIGAFMFFSCVPLLLWSKNLRKKYCPEYAEQCRLEKEIAKQNREEKKRRKSERLAEEALRRAKEIDAKKRWEAEKKRMDLEFQKKRSELRKRGIPSCPKCGSTHIVTVGKKLSRTFLFDYKCTNVKNICQFCGFEFDPGN